MSLHTDSLLDVTLASIFSGGLEERFLLELDKIIRNIQDENTSEKTKREITIKIGIAPDKDRRGGKIKVLLNSTLAPLQELEGHVFFSSNGGMNIAKQFDETQPELLLGETKLVNLRKVAEND